MLSRLAYDKIWLKPEDKPAKRQTCIIFDWDDTILCTSILAPYEHLVYNPNIKLPQQFKRPLKELDHCANLMLKMAKTYGRVYIVTNAAEGWVE